MEGRGEYGCRTPCQRLAACRGDNYFPLRVASLKRGSEFLFPAFEARILERHPLRISDLEAVPTAVLISRPRIFDVFPGWVNPQDVRLSVTLRDRKCQRSVPEPTSRKLLPSGTAANLTSTGATRRLQRTMSRSYALTFANIPGARLCPLTVMWRPPKKGPPQQNGSALRRKKGFRMCRRHLAD
jgi:hypothetical protein